MVYGYLKDADTYEGISEGIAQGFIALKEMDIENLAPGNYETQAEGITLGVQVYESKLPENARLEAHRKYIDIQYVVSGCEKIGILPLSFAGKETEANEEKDIWFYEGKGDEITVREGQFMVIYPEECHAPGIAIDSPSPVKKIVVKVPVDYEV